VAYLFVTAKYDYGPRPGPALAFVIHMAEGGNTVAFLHNNPPRGVSVHYVLESSGRIVQMLREDHTSGSINPQALRRDDDPDGFYGYTAAHGVLGDRWSDPNLAVITVEIEGFAANGPNGAQIQSLEDDLVPGIQERHPGIRNLGHRDFTDTKACPGKHIPWDHIGGHGPGGTGMGLSLTLPPVAVAGTLDIPSGTDSIRVSDGQHYLTPAKVSRPAYAAQLAGGGSTGFTVDLDGDVMHFIRASATGLKFTPTASASCDPAVNAALDSVEAAITAARP
jgi:hypothetical protein